MSSATRSWDFEILNSGPEMCLIVSLAVNICRRKYLKLCHFPDLESNEKPKIQSDMEGILKIKFFSLVNQ